MRSRPLRRNGASGHEAQRRRHSDRAGRLAARFRRLPPVFAEPFDKVLAVNAIMFWDQSIDRLKELRRVMRPGGRIAVAHQPRGPGAGDATARGEEISTALTQGGFSEVRIRTMRLKPAVVRAIGVNPCDGGVRP